MNSTLETEVGTQTSKNFRQIQRRRISDASLPVNVRIISVGLVHRSFDFVVLTAFNWMQEIIPLYNTVVMVYCEVRPMLCI